ncbi:TBP-associated factor 8 [Arctopsyche grandis]|uniref:TBP-associated factor 8 n=1 Tax=Arctopsyche grandis TaxID=121162 RepID=UPI00406DA46D
MEKERNDGGSSNSGAGVGDGRRRLLTAAVSALLLEIGFDAVEPNVLEIFTEMFQCFISEVGNSSRSYCELAGRTEPVLGDVVIALINMGVTLEGLEKFAARPNRHVLAAPPPTQAPRTPAMLSAGQRARPPYHIPAHFPPLPDPHAYVRTPTHKQPVTEYEAIREKAATQKRDVERALTRFLAKTGDTHTLFNTDDNQMFPLIACKPTFPAYLPCLLPTDQVFDFEELEYHFQVANRTEDIPTSTKKEASDGEAEVGDGENNDSRIKCKSENSMFGFSEGD